LLEVLKKKAGKEKKLGLEKNSVIESFMVRNL